MLNFTPSSYERGDLGGSLGHMVPAGKPMPGYDLNYGQGAEKISSPPNMQARGFRQEKLLMSHEGQAEYHGGSWGPGFRWGVRFDGV